MVATPEPRGPHLRAITDAASRHATAEQALTRTVGAARDAGHTWAEIGEVLGVSRQAAFKRFGVVTDPATRRPVAVARTADVAGLASEVFTRWAAGDVAWVHQHMTHQCARELSRSRLDAVWRDVLDEVGALERVGDVEVFAGDGRTPQVATAVGQTSLPAVGRVVLHHEAADAVGRVMVNRGGRVAGMLIGPPEAEPTWPF